MATFFEKKSIALVAIALTTLSTQAPAVTVRGARSCGEWVEHRQEKTMSTLATEAWVVGFLSGIAIVRDKDFLKETDAPSIFLWMDKYCKANPLKRTNDGGIELYFELVKQKRL